MVKEYLKNHKNNNIEGVKKWAVVHVRFLSCEKVFQFGADEDEVSFDIENITSEQGINDLVSQNSVRNRKAMSLLL